jgi:hypothetical protein
MLLIIEQFWMLPKVWRLRMTFLAKALRSPVQRRAPGRRTVSTVCHKPWEAVETAHAYQNVATPGL